MKIFQTKIIAFFLFSILFCANGIAQEDDYVESEEGEYVEVDENGDISNTIDGLRLKKNYNYL